MFVRPGCYFKYSTKNATVVSRSALSSAAAVAAAGEETGRKSPPMPPSVKIWI